MPDLPEVSLSYSPVTLNSRISSELDQMQGQEEEQGQERRCVRMQKQGSGCRPWVNNLEYFSRQHLDDVGQNERGRTV